MKATSTDLVAAAEALAGRIVEWRRALHRKPELGFEEHATAAFVAERLRDLGIETRTGIASTGVVGLVRANRASGPAVLLRADMDALPIQEVEGRPYGSEIPGRMHACGHDGHMAMLLGAASLLVDRRASLTRDVVLCFQPGEEGFGGAERMIADGVLELTEVGSAFAIHLWSMYECGTLHVRPGPIMAAQDEFAARIVGVGGHGALPHQARDPIVAAAGAVSALQSIVSRSVDPMRAAVVTVGMLRGGSAPNVIPDVVEMRGTLRSFDPRTRQLLRDRVRETLEGSCRAAGCQVEFDLIEGYPAVVNDAAAVERVRQAAVEVVGASGVRESDPLAAAEDFAYFLEQRPGALMLLGAGNAARGIVAPHHSPSFDIDEAALPLGAALLARLALG